MLRVAVLLGLLSVCSCVFAQDYRSIQIEHSGSSTYLLFAQASAPIPPRTGRRNAVRALPRNPSKVSFVFADGDIHDYTIETIKRNASFAVLLQGEEQLRFRRRGLAGFLRSRSKLIHGDTVLLRKLQTKDLETLRYEHEDLKYYDGAPRERFVSSVIMHLTRKETADLRKKANGVSP